MDRYQDLCREVERKAGRTFEKRSDFEWLSEQLMAETHELISSSTLMRLWGYRESVQARRYTLDVLARYVGFDNYVSFENANAGKATQETQDVPSQEIDVEKPQESINVEDNGSPRGSHKWLFAIVAVALLAVGASLALLWRSSVDEDPAYEEKYILRKGQRFPTYESYLKLFGITEPKGLIWSQPVPHYNNIIIFGGEYHHHHWGNEGDSTDLLPTRTEHWHDPDVDPEVEVMQNSIHYYQQLEINRLAITFMKNLVDTGFVFCGVYRMSLEQSDTTHVVWERVADECNILHLETLEHLR